MRGEERQSIDNRGNGDVTALYFRCPLEKK
jgi:hypothetical protein